jgi:hypothetical protein
MSRSLRPAAVAALGVAASFALPATALANRPPNLTCKITATTLFYSGTYDNVTVPPGQTCELSGATILGNVTVQTAGSVAFESPGSVGGNLLVGQLASASEGSGWVISGGAVSNEAASMTFQGTVHGILANDTQTLALGSATVDGNVISNRDVFGGVVSSSVITGDLVISATTGDPAVAGDWFIAGPQLDGSPQEIDGSVDLTNNQVPIYLFDNHIKKSLVCQGNNPAPFNSFEGITNTVDGRSTGQCATTNPVGGAAANAAKARATRATSS